MRHDTSFIECTGHALPLTMLPVMTAWSMAALFVLVILFVTNVVNIIPAGAATLPYWLLGVVSLAYLGANPPLRLSGELTGRDGKARTQCHHLLLGGVLVTLAPLIVQGPHANYTQFALISTVNLVLGKLASNVVAVCLMGSLLLATVTYQIIYVRVLMVGGVNGQMPLSLSKLNRFCAPVALRWQMGASLMLTLFIYCTPPSIIAFDLSPADRPIGYQNVTLVWAFSQRFLLLSGAHLCECVRKQHRQHVEHLLPQLFLWALTLLGSMFSVLAMSDTFLNPWATAWGQTVGGVTVSCLLIATIASMIAPNEASWETFHRTAEPEAEGAPLVAMTDEGLTPENTDCASAAGDWQ